MNKTTALQVSPYLFPILKIHNPRDFTDPNSIISFVCESFDVQRKYLHTEKGMRGIERFAVVRQVCFYMLHKFTSLTLKTIGNFFDERHHTTVLHAVKCVNNIKDTRDKEYFETIVMIERFLNERYQVYDRTRY